MDKSKKVYDRVDDCGYNLVDRCRDHLTQYTIQALAYIPEINKPLILDMGCGSGVPTITVLRQYPEGHAYAVDSDQESLLRLEQKVKALGYAERTVIINASVFELAFDNQPKFDLILAEGLLNVIGFEEGLTLLLGYLKPGGYLVIHDELHDDAGKRERFKHYHLELLTAFVLDEKVWWNDYYAHLENAVNAESAELPYKQQRQEIDAYRADSSKFKSIYYVLRS